MFREIVVGAKMWLFTIDLIDGKVTEEEKRNMRDFLSTIISKRNIVPPDKTYPEA
jgi:hypothetical protein